MTMYPTLTCTLRTDTGSNASRKMRQQGLLPATVYGHGAAVSLVLDRHHFNLIEHASRSGSQLVNLSIDGKDNGLALVKTVQRDAIKRTALHLDLQRISLQEKLHAAVSVVLEGDSIGVQEGGMLEMTMHALQLSCAAGSVPASVTYDISEMKIGDTLEAGAFALPEGCELLTRSEECVALIRAPIRVAETIAEPVAEATPTPVE
ncbi:MAG: 50S ribosomal protein L25 [Armatimonadota bacterium]